MSLYNLFETNEDRELDGFDLIIYDGDVEIKFVLARAGGSNRKFANRLQALTRPYQRSMENGTMPEDKAAALMAQAIAETIILDWENVADRNGDMMEYSPARAKQLLIDLPDLRQIIMEEASKASNFIAKEVEEGQDF
jgi:hypothetical protein